uniref:BED-type domain-containing protein n=1 Tax=Salarias fasciatus TaxID=181472 RepID=A0A672HBW8_SALFA
MHRKRRRQWRFYVQTEQDSDGKNLTFLCKLCPPGLNKQVRTSATLSSNLKRHIELKHPSYLGKYLRLNDERKKSLTKRGPPVSKPTQVKLTAFSEDPATSFVSQQVDKLVMDYIVGDLQPLSKVEKRSFIKLVTGLQPSRHVPSRKQAQTLLNNAFQLNFCDLKNKLPEVDVICMTADCWSTVNKVFLGITVHWLNKNNISQRSSAVLACRHARGVHKEFRIQNKIVCTVTDNAANFVKAFNCFAEDFATADENTDPDVDSDNGATKNEQGSTSPTDAASESFDEEDDMEPEPLSALEDPRLPPHRRYMAHTLNLVAKDTKKVTDKQYKTLSSQTVLSEAADAVTHAYDNLILHAVCDEFGFRRFSAEEISFIHKFVDVMRPLASALNILQGEKNIFFGYLAPTIVQLQNDLNGLSEESTNPTAALCLIHNKTLISPSLVVTVTKIQQLPSSGLKKNPQNLKGEADTYLDAPPTDGFAEYMLLPRLKKLFLKYSTALPSSAPVERLFSIGGQIFRPRRNRLGDESFEKQLLLNAKRKLKEV